MMLVISGDVFTADINPSAAPPDAMTTTTAIAPPAGFIGYCLQNIDDCVGRGMPGAIVAMNDDRKRELDDTQWTVNRAIAPRENPRHEWAYPVDQSGDCNTYALAKRKALLARGWPQSSLLLVAAMTERNEGHLVLVARTDAGDFVLDNRERAVVDWKSLPYRWVSRQSDSNPGSWVGIAASSQPTATRLATRIW